MIRGAQQAIEYKSSASRLYYTIKDEYGEERRPIYFPTIEIQQPDEDQLVAPATTKAELDFGAAGCANFDSVFQGRSAGTWAHDWTGAVAAGASLAITLDHLAKTLTVTYEDGVTTVADVEAALAALKGNDGIFEVKTAGTGASVLSSPGDDLTATAFSGGAGAAMLPVLPEFEGYLDYTGQTAEFEDGEELTGGTSGATGIIRGQRKVGDTGTLFLSNVDGTFQSGETITCGASGSATAHGDLYSCEYYYDVDASSSDDYDLGENYIAKITFYTPTKRSSITSPTAGNLTTRFEYFNVAFYPMCFPLVTSQDIERIHPTWLKKRPNQWRDWGEAVRGGHWDLVMKIYSLGEQAEDYVKRESEMRKIGLAFTEKWIAVNCEFEEAQLKRWEKNAETEWGQRGLLTKQTDDDAEIEDGRVTLQAKLLR